MKNPASPPENAIDALEAAIKLAEKYDRELVNLNDWERRASAAKEEALRDADLTDEKTVRKLGDAQARLDLARPRRAIYERDARQSIRDVRKLYENAASQWNRFITVQVDALESKIQSGLNFAFEGDQRATERHVASQLDSFPAVNELRRCFYDYVENTDTYAQLQNCKAFLRHVRAKCKRNSWTLTPELLANAATTARAAQLARIKASETNEAEARKRLEAQPKGKGAELLEREAKEHYR